ncbi:uncharacterized protein LOC143247373 isoform X2 [Tachypleus tridentatus]|uniref:uncharacterized protein LOC143247373 isoform X2 n=1 Tax=Tachypleus tridentatus TaxID=6853 RepID=UPI003FD1F224
MIINMPGVEMSKKADSGLRHIPVTSRREKIKTPEYGYKSLISLNRAPRDGENDGNQRNEIPKNCPSNITKCNWKFKESTIHHSGSDSNGRRLDVCENKVATKIIRPSSVVKGKLSNIKSSCLQRNPIYVSKEKQKESKNIATKSRTQTSFKSECKNMRKFDGKDKRITAKWGVTTGSNPSGCQTWNFHAPQKIAANGLVCSASDKWAYCENKITDDTVFDDELYAKGDHKQLRTFEEVSRFKPIRDEITKIDWHQGSKEGTSEEHLLIPLEDSMQIQTQNNKVFVKEDLTKETMLEQNAETRLDEAQSENRRYKARLISLQRDLQRMEGMVKSVLQFKSYLDELRREKSTTALKYENKIRSYQACVATLEKGNLLLLNELQRKNEEEKPGEEKERLLTQHFFERLKLLDQENSLLRQENETQRLQYEHCLDEVANQVVQALLGQKNLREECQRLEERVQELEHQNSVLAFVLKQQLKPSEMGFQSEISQIASTSQGSDESPDRHQILKPTWSQQNEIPSSFDKEFGREKTMNISCLNNSETTVTKSANVVQVGTQNILLELTNDLSFNGSDSSRKIQQQQKEVVQHSKDLGVSSETLPKPVIEKELLSVDNLSPLSSSNKLTVPSHRTVQNIVARFTHSMNEIGQVFSNDSQLPFNFKALLHSSSSISAFNDSSSPCGNIGNSVSEAERNLQFKKVIPPCSNLDHGFHVSGNLKEASSPSKLSKHVQFNKPGCSKQETLQTSSALKPVGVINFSKENNTNTVIRKIQSNNDSDITNNSYVMTDAIRSRGLFHSVENIEPNVDDDHVSKDEGYSTMSSDIQIEINENQKSNIHDVRSFLFNGIEHLVKTTNPSFTAVKHKMSVNKNGETASSSGLSLFQFCKPPLIDVDGTRSSIRQSRCIVENKDPLIASTQEGNVAKETRSISQRNEDNPEESTDWERTTLLQEFGTINTHLVQKNEKANSILYCRDNILADNPCKTNKESTELGIEPLAEGNENIKQLGSESRNQHTEIKPFILLNHQEMVAKQKSVVSDFCDRFQPRKTHIQNRRSCTRTTIPHFAIRRNVSDSHLYIRKEVNSSGYNSLRFSVQPLERCVSVCESPFPVDKSRNIPEKGAAVVQCISTLQNSENSPVCSDSLSSVCSSTSNVTNSEESEDLKPASLKCSRDNDLWSPSEDECDFPEHYTFVQEWLQQEGEQCQQECSGVYSIDKEEMEGWRFQKSLDGIETTVAENYSVVEEELIPWKNRVIGNTKEKRIMEGELNKPLSRLPIRKIPSFQLKNSNISKIPLSKTKTRKSQGVTGRSCNKHSHEHTETFCRNPGTQDDIKNDNGNSYWSTEIDWKRVDGSVQGITATPCSDDKGNDSSEEVSISTSKQISDLPKGDFRCDGNAVQMFQTPVIPSEINALQNESPSFKANVYEYNSPQCLKVSGKTVDNQAESISADQIDFEDTLLQCGSNLDSSQSNLDQNVNSNTHADIQTNSLSVSMNSKNGNEYFSSKHETLTMSTHSFFARPKCQIEENQLLRREEQPIFTNVRRTSVTSQKPVIQSIKTNTHKIKPLVPPKPHLMVAGSSKIPVPGNYRSNKSNCHKTFATKIPSFPSSSVTVLKKEKEGLDRSKRKLLPNKNVPLAKGKLRSSENCKKTPKNSKQINSTQSGNRKKETNQVPTASKRHITKPVENKTGAENSEKNFLENPPESSWKKDHISLNQQRTGVDLEQLSFETCTLSVAQKLRILNTLLDENETISLTSCFSRSDSTNVNDNSQETSPEIGENNKEGSRSSWIHVSPDINFRDEKVTSQLFESVDFTSISSEESEMDETNSNPQKSFQDQNGQKSGEFPSSPVEEESPMVQLGF